MQRTTAAGISLCLAFAATSTIALDTTTTLATETVPAPPFAYTIGPDTYTFGNGDDEILTGATLASGLDVISYADFPVSVQAIDNALVSGVRSRFFSQLSNPANVFNYQSSYPFEAGQFSYDAILAGRALNRGILDAFKNTADTFNQFAGNIERIDYVSQAGFVVPTTAAFLEEGGHLLIEKSANNGAQIAAILTLDGAGNPASYGNLVSVSPANMTEAAPDQEYGFVIEGTVSTAPTQNFQGLNGTNSGTSTEAPGGALVTWGADLGLTAGQTYFGVSIFPDDVSNANDLVGLTDVSLTTADNEGLGSGGADIYAGTGTIVASALAIAELDSLNGSDNDGDGLTNTAEAAAGTDPDDADSDNDGLTDFEELGANGVLDVGETNPLDADSDDDGLNDGDEVNGNGLLAVYGPTDPLDADSDNDLIDDGVEAGVSSPGALAGTSEGVAAIAYAGTNAPFDGDADPSSTTDPTNDDTDGDGIDDGVEDANQDGETVNTIGITGTDGTGETDPNNTDTDGDGLSDGIELNATGPLAGIGATDPLDSDTDDGGTQDGIEVLADGTDPVAGNGADDGAADPDDDGLSNDQEAALGTDPDEADTDGDGIDDGDEVGNDATFDAADTDPLDADTDDDGLADGAELLGLDGVINALDATDPLVADSDFDGVNDGTEASVITPVAAGVSTANGVAFLGTDTGSANFVIDADPATMTDPSDPDSDNDTLLDGAEDANADGAVTNTIGATGTAGSGETDPGNADTDGDGLGDGDETAGTGPLMVLGATDPLDTDTDDGGVQDGTEVLANGTDPRMGNGADDGDVDSDGDGLTDTQEADLGSDPNDADTDGDGLQDGDELGNDGVLGAGDTNPLDSDTDDDGVADGLEVLGADGLPASGDETDPTVVDSDNDGLSDGLELGVTMPLAGGNSDANGTPYVGTNVAAPGFMVDADPTSTTDPGDPDSDNDGLTDGAEDVNGDGATVNTIGATGTMGSGETDPNNADTDDDDLNDGTELGALGLLAALGATSPLDLDTDDGGVNDGTELLVDGTNPVIGNGGDDGVDPEPEPEPEPEPGPGPGPGPEPEPEPVIDTDADGIPDDVEGTVDTDGDGMPDSQDVDSDADGITDAIEAGAQPTMPVDTDGDGLADFVDTDSDDDGFSDALESEDGGDFNGDGIQDRLQAAERGGLITSVDGGGGATSPGILLLLFGGALFSRRSRRVFPLFAAIGAVFFSVSPAALAKTDCGTEYDAHSFRACWYAGIGYGGSHVDPERESNGWSTDDNESDGWELMVGWHFKPHWFAELKYADIGEAGLGNNVPAIDRTYPDAAISYKVPSVMAGYLLRNPDSWWNVYGKIGVAAINNTAEDDGGTAFFEEVTDVQLALGIGAQLRMRNSPWFVRAEFDSYDKDAWYGALSLHRYFGGRKPKSAGLIAPAEPAPRAQPVPSQSIGTVAGVAAPASKISCDQFNNAVPGVTFHSASADLTDAAMNALRPFAEDLTRFPQARVEIQAHTDSQGESYANEILSERRAASVRAFLQTEGVKPVQLSILGHGETRPIADNRTVEGRARNRRVEFRVINNAYCE